MVAANKVEQLLDFINTSPTAFHAAKNIESRLLKVGFQTLDEKSAWSLSPGKSYCVTRSGSAVFAFTLPKKKLSKLSLLASHLDSPAFKLRPNPIFTKDNALMLALEIYGAPLISSWMNRDLSLAGRVVVETKGKKSVQLVDLEKPLAVIAQLAIHLNRDVNEKGLEINKHEHINAIIGLKEKPCTLEELLSLPKDSILAHDLFLYPTEKARLIGFKNELIAGARLDNLCSASASLEALIDSGAAEADTLKGAIFFDHEEIGSETKEGAGSTFFQDCLKRIFHAFHLTEEESLTVCASSFCLSLDLTHASHPNYPEKSDPRHPVRLGLGPAVKTSAQKRYATDALGLSTVESLARSINLKLQHYSPRGDIASGTTIGPIYSTKTAITTVDLGVPQLSMHSCRELMAASDHDSQIKLLTHFLKHSH